MQNPLTDPIASLLLDIAIGGAVGWAGKVAAGPRDASPYLLLGIAGALVRTKIVDAFQVHILGAGTLVGAALGAAFFVIGWGQIQSP